MLHRRALVYWVDGLKFPWLCESGIFVLQNPTSLQFCWFLTGHSLMKCSGYWQMKQALVRAPCLPLDRVDWPDSNFSSLVNMAFKASNISVCDALGLFCVFLGALSSPPTARTGCLRFSQSPRQLLNAQLLQLHLQSSDNLSIQQQHFISRDMLL
jgi:hypothetical protein